MSKLEATKDNLEEARRLIEAYGGDVARWPVASAARYGALVSHRELSGAKTQAAVLDDAVAIALAAAQWSDQAGAVVERLQDAILSDYDATQRQAMAPARGRYSGFRSVISLFPSAPFFGRSMIPAGALAGLTALGFAAGAAYPPGAVYSLEDEAFAFVEAAFGETLILEEEVDAWAEG